jgi:hypothetical protein
MSRDDITPQPTDRPGYDPPAFSLSSRHKPDTKLLRIGASGGAEWELLSEGFPMFSTACNPLLPPPTLAPVLPKLNVVGSNPISRAIVGVGSP